MGKDKRQDNELSAKDDQLNLAEEFVDENSELNNNYEEQSSKTMEENVEEPSSLDLPENMNLDHNDDKEETHEDNNLNLPEDENINLSNEEENHDDNNEQFDDENEQTTNSIQNPFVDLFDQEQNQFEQSVLTQDKSSNMNSLNQTDTFQKSFTNAETYEEQQANEQQETIGESSSKTKTSQTQQHLSSNQQNQLTQQLNHDIKSDNVNKSSNKSNEQRTLSEIASFIDQNIQAAFDLEQTEQENHMDDLPALEQNSTDQQTQTYAHAKNIPKDLLQQKQILDSATDEQVKNIDEQTNDETRQMLVDNQEKEDKTISSPLTLQSESINKAKSSSTNEQTSEINENTNEIIIPNDKPYVSTATVEYRYDYVSHVETTLINEQIEYQLNEWYTKFDANSNHSNDAEQLWTQLEYLTQPYVFELCEQLRLLLEPTQRTKYSGDYRTGKRLNMKRIISYIASDFRKDRIWLKRLKPFQRQYQLILAIDDSQSMDNLQVKRLALESLILLGQTLNLLDIGQFGIVSFGEYIRMLQPLNRTFNHENGIQILKQLKFDQTKTLLADVSSFDFGLNLFIFLFLFLKLMESVIHTFSTEKIRTSNSLSQLLIILSDGRGLTVSGKDRLLRSVRHAMSQNIFIVFVILDNINHQESTSIFEINEAIFIDDKVNQR